MPTLVTSYHSGKLDGTYILPPVLYPDGAKNIKTHNIHSINVMFLQANII